MAQVFISVSHRHDSSLVLVQHQEFTITDLAYFPGDFVSIFKLDWTREGSWASATISTVEHSAELTLDWLLQLLFARKAMRLILCDVVARCIIFHLKFENYFVRVKRMVCAEHTNSHDVFHFSSLITRQSLVLLLYLEVSLIWQVWLIQ